MFVGVVFRWQRRIDVHVGAPQALHLRDDIEERPCKARLRFNRSAKVAELDKVLVVLWVAILCPPLALLLLAMRSRKKERPRHEGGDLVFWRVALIWLPAGALWFGCGPGERVGATGPPGGSLVPARTWWET